MIFNRLHKQCLQQLQLMEMLATIVKQTHSPVINDLIFSFKLYYHRSLVHFNTLCVHHNET